MLIAKIIPVTFLLMSFIFANACRQENDKHPIEKTPHKKAVLLKKGQKHDLKPGDIFKDCETCPEMVVIPAGEFMMGAVPQDKFKYSYDLKMQSPRTEITIDENFTISRFEITYAEYNKCVIDGPCRAPKTKQLLFKPNWDFGTPDWPISHVSWKDVQSYLNWLSDITKQEYRLPYENEWEYVARAGTETIFWWGDYLGIGNTNCPDCFGNNIPTMKERKPMKVGSFKPNNFGVYDTLGNVSEMVLDCWVYSPAKKKNKQSHPCKKRTVRGGNYFKGTPYIPRVSMRAALRISKDFSSPFIGFRVYRKLN